MACAFSLPKIENSMQDKKDVVDDLYLETGRGLVFCFDRDTKKK
jgi:hypothetical protein